MLVYIYVFVLVSHFVVVAEINVFGLVERLLGGRSVLNTISSHSVGERVFELREGS